MPYRTQHIPFVLLLTFLLFSCTGTPQLAKETFLPPISISTPMQTTFHIDRSALSYGIFETEANHLTLDISNTIPAQFEDFADISVDDGSELTTYKVQPGESTVVHSMPVGKKRVVVTSGPQTKSGEEITGVFINTITFDKPAVQIQKTGKRIVVYGDSLAVGANVEYFSAEAWPVLLRKYYSVTVNAYGFRSLYDDASTPEKLSRLVSEISAWTPDYIWLAIGTNDHGHKKWPAQEFGKAYAATLDAIHASNSQAVLFAQSPIREANEIPNSFGDTLENYRQQIVTACLARSAWCVFVDGTAPAFPQPNELKKDGFHLTTRSSAKYAEAVLNIIGK